MFGDFDKDGITNIDEFRKKTNPKISDKIGGKEEGGSNIMYYISIIIVLGLVTFFVLRKIKRRKKNVLTNIDAASVNIDPSLRDYIVNTRKLGFKDSDIEDELIKNGWNKNDVENAIRNLK